jgi:hypothetical protein
MFKRKYSLTRAALNGLTIFVILFAAAASVSPAYAAISNDYIANAVKITGATFAMTIQNVATTATTSATDPLISTCSLAPSRHSNSVWFTFTPASSGEVTINTMNSQYDTILAIFKNDPAGGGALIEMGCNDNSTGTTSAITMPLRGGIRYFIEVVRRNGTSVTINTDDMHINYSFAAKTVAWGEPLGKKWDSNDDKLFTFSAGWTDYPLANSYKNSIKVSNNVNNNAITYFDGGSFDLYYALGPGMGFLEVYVDGNLEVTVGQGNASYLYPQVWNSPTYSDNVHKLELKHGVGGTQANFDYIQVYTFPDVTPPGTITTLTATTSTTTGKVTLKWKAVGDDGNVGTATYYELRYFVDPPVINCVADWASGTPYISDLPTPAVAGTAQQMTLSGLVPGVKYYFCLAAWDEAGNMGTPSNRATGIATAGVVYGTGTYDDKHPGWKYTGNWKLVNNPDARYNTLHVSDKVDDSAIFNFTGDQFVLSYITSVLGDLMDVYIDGVYVTTIDQNSVEPDLVTYYWDKFHYTSPILAYGPHVVRLVHTTTLVTPPQDRVQVSIDQIYVWRSKDGGAPTAIADLNAAPGINDGEVNLTWTATGDDGLAGTAKKYEVRYSIDPINNKLDWENAAPAAGNFTAPKLHGTPESMTVVGLTPGAHYFFAVQVSDNAYYDVLSNTIDSDVQYTGAYLPAGKYEDDHLGWQYVTALINGWQTINDVNATSGHYRRIANAPAGSMARFWFSGTRFQLIYMIGTGYGKLGVYVDGIYVGTINEYYSVTAWNRVYTSPVFAAGNHVVEFRVVGTKANIDLIKIIP